MNSERYGEKEEDTITEKKGYGKTHIDTYSGIVEGVGTQVIPDIFLHRYKYLFWFKYANKYFN